MSNKKITKRFKPKSKKGNKKLKVNNNTMSEKRLAARKKYRSWG